MCSEVMSVARMFVRLADLDASRLKNPEVVKELYVVADVVEIDDTTDEYTFAGLERVEVICRVLLWKLSPSPPTTIRIRTPWLNLSSCSKLEICPLRNDRQAQSTSPGFQCFARANKHSTTSETVLFLHAAHICTSNPDTDTSHLNVVLQAQESAQYTLMSADQTPSGEQTILEVEPEFPLSRKDLNSTILSALEANVLVTELILSYMTHATETVEQASLHLEWLNKHLNALNDTSSASAGSLDDEAVDRQLHNLLFQVQFLLNQPPTGAGLIVPRLQYYAYSNLVGTMARIAENYDKEFRQFSLFIEQNDVLGTYLLQQNKAFAEKEKEMEVFHLELQQVKKDDLTRALAKLERLEVDMREMNAAMEQAQRDMEAGLVQYRNRQVARAVFSVIGAIAQLGLAFFTGGATAGGAVAGVGNAVSQVTDSAALASLTRISETLEKLVLVTEFLVAMRDLLNAVMDIHQGPPEVPTLPEMVSEAEWAIFENEIEAVAAGMPAEVSSVLTWKTKCKNVAALGREMITLATIIVDLQHDIKVHGLMREMAQNHAQRLEALQPVDLKNYQEMAAEMDMRTTRMLLGLLEVLSLQNAALHYQYLLPPSPVTIESTNLTMSTAWTLLLQHEAASVISLADLGFATEQEVTYIVKGIPVGLLLDGEDWDFPISVRDIAEGSAFPADWSRVRISHVEMKFVKPGAAPADEEQTVHQPTTNTGKVYMLLQGEQLFADRKRGESFKYEAVVAMEYQYAYKLDTGETTQSNRPSQEFGDKLFMQMTPFTRWKLRLPTAANENRGLAFPTASAQDATTQLTIHFHVSAIRTIF